MGVVFLTREVEFGRIPQQGAQAMAGEMFLEGMKGDAGLPIDGVQTATVYGSIGDGSATPRSDLDVLVVHNRSREVIVHVAALLRKINERTYVKPEPVQFPKEDEPAMTSYRTYDMMFLWHLCKAMQDPRRSIGDKENHLTRSQPDPNDAQALRETFYGYLTYKENEFFMAQLSTWGESESRAKHMQRTLELPRSVGRKLIQLADAAAGVDGGDYCRVDTGRALELATPDAQQDLADLLEMNDQYTEILGQTLGMRAANLRGKALRNYQQWLVAHYPVATEKAYRAIVAILENHTVSSGSK